MRWLEELEKMVRNADDYYEFYDTKNVMHRLIAIAKVNDEVCAYRDEMTPDAVTCDLEYKDGDYIVHHRDDCPYSDEWSPE